jgi:hypothetical protein
MGSNADSATGGGGEAGGTVGNYPVAHREAVVIVEEVLADEVSGEVVGVSGEVHVDRSRFKGLS